MTIAALFIMLFVFMALGMPVAVALGLSSLLTMPAARSTCSKSPRLRSRV